MEHSQLVTYFEEYLKQYAVYKNSKVYNALIDYLKDNFTKNIYEDIPINFRKLYEENNIDISVHDYLLLGLGVPQHVLDKLTYNDKLLFFNNLTDFYRYRGDIDFFKKVTSLFSNSTCDVYELYIDYDEEEEDWFFKPYLIIQNIIRGETPQNIPYTDVYNEVPSLLINKQQLNYYRENNEIILPIKSNIILLNYLFRYDCSSMVALINSTFIKEYSGVTIDVYFKNMVESITLKKFYLLWYYILLKTYNTSHLGGIDLQWLNEYSKEINPYDLNDITRLLVEYDEIETSSDAQKFYEINIENVFKIKTESREYDYRDLESYIDSNFVEYLDERVTEENKDTEYNAVLNELLNSFLLFASTSGDLTFKKYSEYFINSLTRIHLNPKDTSSYVLLNNFKPFHTELLSVYSSVLFCDSKFDMITPEDGVYQFLLKLQQADVYDIVDYSFSNILFQTYQTNQFIDHFVNNILINDSDKCLKKISHNQNVLTNSKDINDVVDYFNNYLKQMSYDAILIVIDKLKKYFKIGYLSKNDIDDIHVANAQHKNVNIYDIVDYIEQHVSRKTYEDMLSLIESVNKHYKAKYNTDNDIVDEFKNIPIYHNKDVNDIVDYIEQHVSGKTYEDMLSLIESVNKHCQLKYNTDNDIVDDKIFDIQYHNKDVNDIVDYIEQHVSGKIYEDILSLIESVNKHYKAKYNTDNDIVDDKIFDIQYHKIDDIDIIDYVNTLVSGKTYEDILSLIESVNKHYKLKYNTNNSFLDDFNHKLIMCHNDSKISFDKSLINIFKKYNEMLHIFELYNQKYHNTIEELITIITRYNFNHLYPTFLNNKLIDYNVNLIKCNELSQKSLTDNNFKTFYINPMSGFSIISNKRFQFSLNYNWVRPINQNINDITDLLIGDYIYNYLDSYENARKIIGFDYEENIILLDDIYQGFNRIGLLMKLNVFHDSLIIRNNVFRIFDISPRLYQHPKKGYINRDYIEVEYVENGSDYILQKQKINKTDNFNIAESFEIIEM